MRDRVAAFREVAGDPFSLMGLGLLAAMRLLERLVLAWGLFVATDDVTRGAVLVLGAGGVHLLRGYSGLHLRIRVRIAVEVRAASALLAADPLAPVAAAGNDDPFATFHESVEQAIRLVVDLIPGSAGDAGAAVVLALWLVATARLVDVAILGGAAVVGAAVAFSARRFTRRRGQDAWRAQMPTWLQLRMIQGARDELVACGRETAAEKELLTRLRGWATVERGYQTVAGVTGRVPVMVAAGLVLLAFVTRARGGLDAALWRQLLVFAAVAAPVTALLTVLHEMTQAERATSSLVELMAVARIRRAAHANEVTLRRDLGLAPRSLVVRDARFRYPGAAVDSLAATSFAWSAGRLLVVTGANGSGKSTLIKLLLRLAEPTSGSLALDGHEAGSFALDSWRRSVTYVSQMPYIDEEATVADFFQLLAPGAGSEAVRRALERTGVWSRLTTSPDPLTVRMRTLSAGQRQRVILARALVQDRPMVVLDEPDASLDADGLTSLVTLLRELCQDRLVAVVAHSPALISAADDRVVLGSTSS